jgi:hypothetical protein
VLGSEGRVGAALAARVAALLGDLVSLSSLTAPLAVDYVQRVARPMAAMTPEAGVRLVAAGYVAHLAVESHPEDFAVTDIPVLGGLPDPDRRGRPPRDLMTRVVKATRRPFWSLCALSPEGWDGLVVAVAAAPGPRLSLPLVDGLLRTGWVLRQVDLAYGLEPERR